MAGISGTDVATHIEEGRPMTRDLLLSVIDIDAFSAGQCVLGTRRLHAKCIRLMQKRVKMPGDKRNEKRKRERVREKRKRETEKDQRKSEEKRELFCTSCV